MALHGHLLLALLVSIALAAAAAVASDRGTPLDLVPAAPGASLAERARDDRHRHAYITSVLRSRGGGRRRVAAPLTSGAYSGTGQFLARVQVGTPPQQFLLVVDTGSDLTWVKCHGGGQQSPTSTGNPSARPLPAPAPTTTSTRRPRRRRAAWRARRRRRWGPRSWTAWSWAAPPPTPARASRRRRTACSASATPTSPSPPAPRRASAGGGSRTASWTTSHRATSRGTSPSGARHHHPRSGPSPTTRRRCCWTPPCRSTP
ncbi:hypothetical protein PR202_gb02068 [Eleusine coracana subsp. coracana]|uniref:Peptidase A1 domain-containing protein n=1 Tax=Eleusine coracana subsp. coracana TaxID=191504 RepID=A0AAV5DWT2_ELECO|nr:hypothetical protein PR202_gb02068 [Eleusine coracana subsp. coracana]